MSEREFELYLSILGGMMKLSSRQRKDLAEELRSHMDERLDELLAEGLTRDDAIQAALEEFGDASGLAANFTQIAQLKQRRRIMRWTTGTIAAVTCAILALASFWPQNNPVGQQIVSETQAQPGPSGGFASGGIVPNAATTRMVPYAPRNAIEQKLAEQYPGGVEFFDAPLQDVFSDISVAIKVDVLFDKNVLDEIDFGQTINLHLEYGKVTTKTLLSLVFEQVGMEEEYSYIVRDEILYITHKEATMTVRVYNCRDLVGEVSDAPNQIMAPGAPGYEPADFEPGDAGGGASETSMMDAPEATNLCQFGGGAGFGGGYGGAPGGMMGGMGPGSPYPGQHELVSVITQTIAPESWTEAGGSGSARLFNGLLVVKNTAEVHQQVEDLLKMIRDAQKLDVGNRNSNPR